MLHWIERRLLDWLVPVTAIRAGRWRSLIGHRTWPQPSRRVK